MSSKGTTITLNATCPIVVTDEESARRAGAWVQEQAAAAMQAIRIAQPRYPTPWRRENLLIKAANGREVVHVGLLGPRDGLEELAQDIVDAMNFSRGPCGQEFDRRVKALASELHRATGGGTTESFEAIIRSYLEGNASE